jgi:hypothetical protein
MRLAVVGAVVAVLVAGAVAVAVWWRWDTDRQPHVDAVVAEMNAAVADVVVAAGSDAAVAVSPVVRSSECRLGLHHGGIFSARADLYTDPGREDSLITSIAGRLPARYAATRGPDVAGVRALQAGLGGAVTVAVRKLSPGWLTVAARSGCSLGTAAGPVPPAGAAATGALTALLGRLGTRPAKLTEQRVHCAGGDIVTVAAVSEPVDSGGLAGRLAGVVPTAAHRFGAGESNRVVYRDGTVSVVMAASDDGTTVDAQYTTVC